MKQKLRLISLLLTVCVLFGVLVSCRRNVPEEPVPTTPMGGQSQTPGQKDDLAYTLTQADVDAMLVAIEECESLFLDGTPTEEEMQAALDDIEQLYTHITTQEMLAYIYYCLDQASEQTSEDYLFASTAVADCYQRYNEMCKRIDESDTVNREFFFRDWTDEDFEEMRGYSEEMNTLSQKNDELLVAYRALDDSEFMNGAAEYYLQMLNNNNRFAVLSGYDTYWEYAYDKIYNRDYSREELEIMRMYVKQVLVPLTDQVIRKVGILFQSLSQNEQQLVMNFLQQDYDSLPTDYVALYTNSYGNEVHRAMQSLFDEKNSFFTDSDASFAGAFTGWLSENERPVCYFGPGYQSANTVVHEMGHYYAALVAQTETELLDLAETQSQGNEWMFISFLKDQWSPMMAEVVFLNQLGTSLISILLCTAVDEFEQMCYFNSPSTQEELDSYAELVLADYGGKDWFQTYVTDFPVYWRMVVLENPVYYISYAVSMLTALQVANIAEQQSYQAAQDIYLDLIETDPELTFTEVLNHAGLRNPLTDRSVYEDICRMAE